MATPLSLSQHRGFTLIEILVSVSIIAILTGLTLAGYSSVLQSSKQVAEITAGRAVISSYLNYANDNDGQLLPGIPDKELRVEGRSGTDYPNYIAKRWPLRLGPYFDYNYPGVAVVNEAEHTYNTSGNAWMAEYNASVFPSFGLNTTFVGGNHARHHSDPVVGSDESTYGSFAITRLVQAEAPSRLIVFVSATADNYGGDTDKTYGNFYVLSPNLTANRWTNEYNENKSADSFGYVHPRWNGRAVAVHLDGSIELLNSEELQDMTRWSNQAASEGDPNWVLSPR